MHPAACLAKSVDLAYVGPGLGIGTLVIIAGLSLSVLLALLVLVWYPVRRALRRLRGARTDPPQDG
jgi:hypothetical protein